jgi:diguanylate cyclase (GGDEF)-like protein/PAS domain S-box-containing protein
MSDGRASAGPGLAELDSAAVAELFAVLPDAVVLIDEFAKVVWANRAATELFGLPFGSAVGRQGLDFIHPDDFPLAAVSMQSVRSKDAGTPIELRVRCQDGWRLVEVVGAPAGDLLLLSIRDLTERRRWEVAGDETARFRSIVQYAASVLMLVNGDGVITAASGALPRLLGQDQEKWERRPLVDLVDEADQHVIERVLADVRVSERDENRTPISVDVRLRHAGGMSVPFALTFVDLLDDPTVQGLVVTGHDITDRVLIEEDLRQANSLLSTTLESTTDGILVVNLHRRVTSFNSTFAELWQLSPRTLRSRDDRDFLASVVDQLVDPGKFLAKVHELYLDPTAQSNDLLELIDGRVYERFSLPQRIGGEIVGRVWSFRDVTEHRRLERELIAQMSHDSLTGLGNRALLIAHAEQSARRLTRDGGCFAILSIDIDNFKTANDGLGHAAGDTLLVAVSERLRQCVSPRDTVFRLGGDEFAVLIDGIDVPTAAAAISERIMHVLEQPIGVGDERLSASVCIGIAYGSAGASPDDVLRNADLAMRSAKSSGKNCVRAFTPEMHAVAVRRLDVEAHLRGSIDRGELVVQYQPIVELRSGQVHGFEALVRWNHPHRGLLPPSEFIAFAEESALIDEIGDHVLNTACEQLAQWVHRDGHPTLTMAINISPRRLLDRGFPARVQSILAHHDLEPSLITLEITEQALMREPEIAAQRLEELHRFGVRIAIDDFGTGYSAFAYLQRFPIDILKIDSTFVNDTIARPGMSLTGALVQVAHALELVPIAEGVENQSQADALAALGCDLAQGFHLGCPAAPDEIDAARLRLEAERHRSGTDSAPPATTPDEPLRVHQRTRWDDPSQRAIDAARGHLAALGEPATRDAAPVVRIEPRASDLS